MFKKLHAKIDEVLAILRLLPKFFADFEAGKAVVQHDAADAKATMAVVQHAVTDVMAGLAEIRAITGHTATVVAMTAQAAVPTSVPILPPAPSLTAPSSSTAPTLQTELKADVAKVNPLAGVHLPGAP